VWRLFLGSNVWYHLVLVHIRKNISTEQMCYDLGWRAEAVVWVCYFTRSVHVKTIELPMYWPEPAPYLAVTYYLQYHLVLVHIRKIIISTLTSIIY
jgi:hypothetical protein